MDAKARGGPRDEQGRRRDRAMDPSLLQRVTASGLTLGGPSAEPPHLARFSATSLRGDSRCRCFLLVPLQSQFARVPQPFVFCAVWPR
eukprot:2047673-Alexandrium_andersonii.AAC.1